MTRQDYITAIAALLDKADFRQLRLVWCLIGAVACWFSGNR